MSSDYSKDLEAAVFHATDGLLRGFMEKAKELKQTNDDALSAILQGTLLGLCHVMVRKGIVPPDTAGETIMEFASYASDCMETVLRQHGKRVEKESATVN